MRGRWTVAIALALAGCGQANEQSATESLSVSEPAPAVAQADAPPSADGGTAGPLAVTVPRIAYIYRYTFRLAPEAVARAQDAHVALCERMGPARCQVIALDSSSGEGSISSGSLKLRVASNQARRFGEALTKTVSAAGGRAVDRSIEAEDVGKSIVDAQARIRQRALLVDRLTAILQTRSGPVRDLVEAERSVAQAQEELDAARGWLAELNGRVALSTIEIGYNAAVPGADAPFFTQLGEDVRLSVALLGGSIRTLVSLVIVLLPWLAIAGLAWFGVRRWRRRRRAVTVVAEEDRG